MRWLLLLLVFAGCGGDDAVKPQAGFARVYVSPEAFVDTVDAYLITESPPYPTFRVTRGQANQFNGLALHVRHTVSMAWTDTLGVLTGTSKNFMIEVDGGAVTFSFTAAGGP